MKLIHTFNELNFLRPPARRKHQEEQRSNVGEIDSHNLEVQLLRREFGLKLGFDRADQPQSILPSKTSLRGYIGSNKTTITADNSKCYHYFEESLEIYDQQSETADPPKLYLEMKVIDIKTGELEISSGLRPVEPSSMASKPAIPVVWDMAINKLPPGSYRIEVQASDSKGKKSDWRMASFVLSGSPAPQSANLIGSSGMNSLQGANPMSSRKDSFRVSAQSQKRKSTAIRIRAGRDRFTLSR